MMREDKMQGWKTVLITLIFLGIGITSSFGEGDGVLMVDRFTGGVNSEGIPVGWQSEKSPGSQSKISVVRGQEDYYLRFLSVDDGFGLRKDISFDIRKYPYLSWYWRVVQLPKGGDIRKRETDDQAGQIYVIFPKFPKMINSRSMGYVWDTQAPVGMMGTSTAYSKMKYVVLQSGAAKLNQWIFETRNVYEDYKKSFDEDPPEVGSVLIYINSQHTHSSAECHTADIYFSAKPPKP